MFTQKKLSDAEEIDGSVKKSPFNTQSQEPSFSLFNCPNKGERVKGNFTR